MSRKSTVGRNEFDQLVQLVSQHGEQLNWLRGDIERQYAFLRLYIIGKTCLEYSDFQSARSHLEKALNIQPSDKDCRLALARSLTYLDELYEARAHFDVLLARFDNDADILRACAFNCRFSEPNAALDYLKRADQLDLSPTQSIQIKNALGLLYRDLGRIEKATESHELALSIDQGETVTRYFLGVCYLMVERRKEGVNFLGQAFRATQQGAEVGTIKRVWADVIRWTYYHLESRTKEAEEVWGRLKLAFSSPYLRSTILAHADCVRARI